MEERILKTIQVYNEHANDYHRINASLEPIQDLLDFFIASMTGKRILDIGCGPGRDAKYLSMANFEVFGIDLSRNFLDIAEKNAPRAKFRLMDMRKLDFPGGFFDGIWAAASVLHIPKKDALSTLRGFRTVLKSEGLLYIGLYHGQGEKMIIASQYDNKERFYALYSVNEAKQLLRRAGFQVVKEIIKQNEEKKPTWINFFAIPTNCRAAKLG
ncbi:MAG: class I SAM-dependent methyltransferase [Candidatus Hodarchaeota archaeon]